MKVALHSLPQLYTFLTLHRLQFLEMIVPDGTNTLSSASLEKAIS